MFVIIETRIDSSKHCKKFNDLGFDGYDYMNVRGYAWWIAMGWKTNKINVKILKKHFQFIHAKIKVRCDLDWRLTIIYVRTREEGRNKLWGELKIIADNVDCGWLVSGDFNDILVGSEKRGWAPPLARKCGLFQDRTNGCNLMDLCSSSYKYTWRDPISQGGLRVYERLERVLSNDQWWGDDNTYYI